MYLVLSVLIDAHLPFIVAVEVTCRKIASSKHEPNHKLLKLYILISFIGRGKLQSVENGGITAIFPDYFQLSILEIYMPFQYKSIGTKHKYLCRHIHPLKTNRELSQEKSKRDLIHS